MSKVYINKHPLVQHKISILRDKNTGTNEFRSLVGEIAMLMGYEALNDLPTEEVEVETPLEKCMTEMISGRKMAIVPILRAGLGMVDGILQLVPASKVGHIGLYRDEETHTPVEYYCKLPNPIEERIIVVTDPMLATGGSAIDAISQIKKHGGKKIKFMCIIAAPEGLKALEEAKAGQDGEWSAKIMELMDAVDSYIPTPVRATDKDLLMPIEDVFSISGRGTVVTGRIEKGVVKVGDTIEIVGIKPTQTTTVTGVEMFRKEMDQGEAGDNVGVLLRGTKKEDVERGMVLCKPKSITPHTKFEGEVYILTKEEGGRHTPFFNNYRPQFYVRTTDVTGSITLPEGTEMVMPGDNVRISVELIAPVALEEGTRFAIREGGRTVGSGVVSKILG